jgi:hypothetical protein
MVHHPKVILFSNLTQLWEASESPWASIPVGTRGTLSTPCRVHAPTYWPVLWGGVLACLVTSPPPLHVWFCPSTNTPDSNNQRLDDELMCFIRCVSVMAKPLWLPRTRSEKYY